MLAELESDKVECGCNKSETSIGFPTERADMRHLRRLCVMGIAVLSLATSSGHAEAQWPPEKTVRIVVPFAAGGVGDVLIRLLAERVSDKTKQKIVTEPRPGGGGVIGTEAVARSSPDGATLLFVANSFLINASLKAGLPYDPLTSFEPICLLARSPLVLVVNTKSSHQSLSQFIAAARQPQSELSVGGDRTQHNSACGDRSPEAGQ